MFNKTALANSLAILAAAFYLIFYFLSLIAPNFFSFIFNAQFLGANVASLMPQKFSFGNFLGTLIALTAVSWLTGYLWGSLYNRLTK